MEVLVSLLVIAMLSVMMYSILSGIGRQRRKERAAVQAVLWAQDKLQQLISKNFENIVEEGCYPLSGVSNEEFVKYLGNSEVCVNVISLNWDSVSDIDAKQIVVKVRWDD